jgi:hypothetical protein
MLRDDPSLADIRWSACRVSRLRARSKSGSVADVVKGGKGACAGFRRSDLTNAARRMPVRNSCTRLAARDSGFGEEGPNQAWDVSSWTYSLAVLRKLRV